MKKYLKYAIITILIIGVGLGVFFAIRPVFNTDNTSNSPSIETPIKPDNQENQDDNNSNSDNDNSDNNSNDNQNNDNSGNDNSNNNDDNNTDNNNPDNNDDSNNNDNNPDDNNNNDNNPDDNNDNENNNNENNDNSGENDDSSDNDNTLNQNTYSFEIYFDKTLVYSDTTQREIFSDLKNGSFTPYTLVITSNYELPAVTTSENITITSQSSQDFNVTIEFVITNGTSFSFTIDNKTTTLNCTPYKQYSHQITLAVGTTNATIDGNTITLTNTNTVAFQILIFENDIQISCTLSSDDITLHALYGGYFVEIDNCISAQIKVNEYDYSFVINFIVS